MSYNNTNTITSVMNTNNSLNSIPVVYIYTGRFSPFHKGHLSIYNELKKRKRPQDHVFVTTTDKFFLTESFNKSKDNKTRYPFDFETKKKIMTELADVDPEHIIKVSSNYNIHDEKLIKKTTQLGINLDECLKIFVVSEKDMEEEPRFKNLNGDNPSLKQIELNGQNSIPKRKRKRKTPTGNNILPKHYYVIQKFIKKQGRTNTTYNSLNLNKLNPTGRLRTTGNVLNKIYIDVLKTSAFEFKGMPINSATQIRNIIMNPEEYGTTLREFFNELYGKDIEESIELKMLAEEIREKIILTHSSINNINNISTTRNTIYQNYNRPTKKFKTTKVSNVSQTSKTYKVSKVSNVSNISKLSKVPKQTNASASKSIRKGSITTKKGGYTKKTKKQKSK